MNCSYRSLCTVAVALCLTKAASAADSFETTLQPFAAKYCYSCHNGQLKSGGLDLSAFRTLKSFDESRPVWQTVARRLSAGEMPPAGTPHPPADQMKEVTSWLRTEFERQDAATPLDPGRVTARRLNRYEYNASVRDLLGLEFRPADDFPADDFGYGFDNIGDILSLSPTLMEKYLTAAKKIAHAAIDAEPAPKTPVVDHRKNLAEQWPFTWNRRFSWEGDYEVRFAVPYFVDGRHDPGTIYIAIDGAAPQAYPLATEYSNEGRYQDVKVHVSAGMHQLKGWAVRADAGIVADEWKKELDRQDRRQKLLDAEKNGSVDVATSLIGGGRGGNGGNAGANGAANFQRRALPPEVLAKRRADLLAPPLLKEDIEKKIAGYRQPYIESVEVHGPWNPGAAPRPESYNRVFACGQDKARYTDACIATDLASLARRAWRRPVTKAESTKLLSFVKLAQKQGDGVDDAMKVGVMAVLVSPNFLFRMERAPASGDANSMRRLNSIELASRLSYFLWSSIPDEELLGLAEHDKLTDPAVLEQQVRRMLKDPKAEALVDNFGAQWLLVRNLDSIKPDPDKFPQFNGALRAAMKEETRLFFSNVIQEDRSIFDFLTAKYTWVNEQLAEFYGISGVTGGEFRKVDLTGTHRMGILTQASVLTVSSYPTRTSPVIRGKWILENLLNAPPPPPPPNVPSLDASGVGATGTLREQMEKHRANALCASCHAKMDPLGFGLENFDAIGRWRTTDGKFPIDSEGTMPDGKSFATPEQLVELLASDKEAFTSCLTEKLMTFALGRGLEAWDQRSVTQIVRSVAARDYRFSGALLEIVKSAPFQMRRIPQKEDLDKKEASK